MQVQRLNQAEEIAPNNIDLLMRRARAHACKSDILQPTRVKKKNAI